jgi:predicted PolB exonuclease-like 3'-5' exonuclease
MLSYFDLETVAREDIAHLLKPVEADKRLTDPAKIAADVLKKESSRKLALDPFCCRIVAVGRADGDNDIEAWAVRDEADERHAIRELFTDWHEGDLTPVSFNGRAFDHRVLTVRAWALSVEIPVRFRKITRYSDNVIDLYADFPELSDERAERFTSHGLVGVCDWFGIPVDADDLKGADIAEAVKAERWDEILTHVRRDVERTRLLARKLGVA